MPRFFILAKDPLVAAEAAAECLPAGVEAQTAYGWELSIDQVFEQLGQPDLFAASQAFHYIDIAAFKPGKKTGERISAILDRLPPQITLVCSQVIDAETKGEEKRQVENAELKRWSSGATLRDLRQLSEGGAALDWLARRAAGSYRLQLTRRQAERVLQSCGGSLALADTELRKLALLREGSEPLKVSEAQLNDCLSQNPAQRFYEMAEAVLSGSPQALAMFNVWAAGETGPAPRLLGHLARSLLELLAVSRGGRVEPAWKMGQLQRGLQKWPAPRLRAAILLLAEADFAFKSGQVPGENARDAELALLQVYLTRLMRLASDGRG
jgi:DNA polymerase III delta subunit